MASLSERAVIILIAKIKYNRQNQLDQEFMQNTVKDYSQVKLVVKIGKLFFTNETA